MSSAMKINGIGIAGARTHNEALRVQHSGSNAPILQGFSPLSSACLYRRTQSSTPCAILAKSLDSTLDWRYSMISAGRETVNEIFLDPLGIQVTSSKLLLYSPMNVKATSSKLLDGALQHDRNQPISESSGVRGGVGNPAPGRRGGRHGRHHRVDAAGVPSGRGGPDGAFRGCLHIGALGHSIGASGAICGMDVTFVMREAAA